jgi:hypothetical protein
MMADMPIVVHCSFGLCLGFMGGSTLLFIKTPPFCFLLLYHIDNMGSSGLGVVYRKLIKRKGEI